MNYKQKIGKFGEILAKNYLVKHGYRVINTNFKTSYQEIDIVAYFKGIYVFIEVKTRTNNQFGLADDSMTNRKMNSLKKAISKYLSDLKIYTENIRLDLIAIDFDRTKKIANIKHYKDIF